MHSLIFNIILIFTVSTSYSSQFDFVYKNNNLNQYIFNYENYKKNIELLNNYDNTQNEFIDEKIPNLDPSFFYQYNGEIIIKIDSFKCNILKGNPTFIIPPKLDIKYEANIRNNKIHNISINPIMENDTIKLEYDIIYFTIDEINNDLFNNNFPVSRMFTNITNELTINDSRNISSFYQKPAILYITGGNSASSPYFQDLINLKVKKGFAVYNVSTAEIGSNNASDIKEYIQNAYNSYNPPPEFICLVGDDGGSYDIPSFRESISGYFGEGDHPYTLLEGDDIISDILIGRISARTQDHLNTIINKIINYESASFLNIPNFDNSWIERAALVSDPYPSGNSTIITNQYISETILEAGFEEVVTNFGENNYDLWMLESINSGISFLNYRGWWGVSGFDEDEVNSLSNIMKFPFTTFITCGTGSFSEQEESLIEAMLRAGSVNNPVGAIAAIGTATSGTHTSYNNIFDMGIYNGIFSEKATYAGEALQYGKLALLNTYPSNPNDVVSIFSHWNNLMGDPSTQLWTKTPINIDITFSSELRSGTNNYGILVKDSNNNQIANARVVVILNEEIILLNDITDEQGYINSNMTIGHGNIKVYVNGQNITPLEKQYTIEIPNNGVYVNLEEVIIDDIYGSHAEVLYPDNEYSITFPCINISEQNTGLLSCYLISSHPELYIIQDTLIHDGIPQFSEDQIGPFNFNLSPNFYNGEQVSFIFIIQDIYSNSWSSLYDITLQSYHPQIINNFVDESILPGSLVENNSFIIKNSGILEITDLMAELLYEGNELDIDMSIFELGNILPAEEIISPNFSIYASNFNIVGKTVNIPIKLYNENGYEQIEYMNIQIGNLSPSDPTGPDSHGYYMFGTNDLNKPSGFEYEWIEIDPYYGGNGNNLMLYDQGNGVGDQISTIEYIQLPFIFQFYGDEYDHITISSNGWLSFGNTSLSSFRNYPIPGPGGPNPMIAAFWDDLKAEDNSCSIGYLSDCSGDLDCCPIQWLNDGYADCIDQVYGCDLSCYDEELNDCNGISQVTDAKDIIDYLPYQRSENGGAVFYLHDFENNQFIVEWSDMKTYQFNDEQDFQIILQPIANNDGEIKINYKTFNNTSYSDHESQTPIHGQFSTVGIENLNQSDGLEYSYNNFYSPGSGEISDEFSILITRFYDPYDYTVGDLNFDGNINVSDIVYIVSIIMNYIDSDQYLDELGDINNDHQLNVSDIVILVHIILND